MWELVTVFIHLMEGIIRDLESFLFSALSLTVCVFLFFSILYVLSQVVKWLLQLQVLWILSRQVQGVRGSTQFCPFYNKVTITFITKFS